MGVAVGSNRCVLGLAGGVLRGTNGGLAGGVKAVVQALTQQFDLWNDVQVFVGQQAAQVRHQFLQFALSGGVFRCVHGISFFKDKLKPKPAKHQRCAHLMVTSNMVTIECGCVEAS